MKLRRAARKTENNQIQVEAIKLAVARAIQNAKAKVLVDKSESSDE
jgi:hypothetical protein